MKYILTILLFLSSFTLYAENLVIKKHYVEYKSICIGNYLFAIAYSIHGLELKQIYKISKYKLQHPQPVRCIND